MTEPTLPEAMSQCYRCGAAISPARAASGDTIWKDARGHSLQMNGTTTREGYHAHSPRLISG